MANSQTIADKSDSELEYDITLLALMLGKCSQTGDYSPIDEVFRNVDVTSTSYTDLIVLLRTTYSIRKKISEWEALLIRANIEMTCRDPNVLHFRGLIKFDH